MDSILNCELASVLLFGIKVCLAIKIGAHIYGGRGAIALVSEDHGFAHAENVVDGF
ncbi:MAG: hypothetical protein WBQ76_01390 [Candidatus Korobacteraceae bacterium]